MIKYSIVIRLEDSENDLNFSNGFYLDNWNIEKIKEYIEIIKLEIDFNYNDALKKKESLTHD